MIDYFDGAEVSGKSIIRLKPVTRVPTQKNLPYSLPPRAGLRTGLVFYVFNKTIPRLFAGPNDAGRKNYLLAPKPPALIVCTYP